MPCGCRAFCFYWLSTNNTDYYELLCNFVINNQQLSVILTASSLADLPELATQLLAHTGNNKIFLFQGDMGAGKTTFIKSLCEQLGVKEAVTSPTFAIVNEYQGANAKIYHFDFYRLKNQTEALDMGAEEYFYSGNYCFIEWPDKIPDMLPLHYVAVKVKALPDNSREISVDII
ncbi:MAG: tRNA (adenosine(37)-N6)-threonylcarbamoyltransferase complex ATPase subunit type 1 TsaE [Bacteroidota bacterium]